MRRNALSSLFPNLSLISGYVFIIGVMALFGYVQYSSSRNLESLEDSLRDLTFELLSRESEEIIDDLIGEYSVIIDSIVLNNLYQTLHPSQDFQLAESIENREKLNTNIQLISRMLEYHEKDLSRSQSILLMAFIMQSLILSIILTISEYDQFKKLERERSRRQIDRKLMDILENERNMIAVELHDDVAQKLSVINRHFQASGEYEHTEVLKRYNRDVIHKIRTLAQSLRSPDLEQLSFRNQLEFLFSDFRSVSSIKLQTSINGLSAINLGDDGKLHIFRIIQELLTNCRKHSGAENVIVNVLYVHPSLIIRYKDDGVGLSDKRTCKGMGLRSIQYRLNILKGTEVVNPGEGHSIKITIPVDL